jgi:hypothetical protein
MLYVTMLVGVGQFLLFFIFCWQFVLSFFFVPFFQYPLHSVLLLLMYTSISPTLYSSRATKITMRFYPINCQHLPVKYPPNTPTTCTKTYILSSSTTHKITYLLSPFVFHITDYIIKKLEVLPLC